MEAATIEVEAFVLHAIGAVACVLLFVSQAPGNRLIDWIDCPTLRVGTKVSVGFTTGC